MLAYFLLQIKSLFLLALIVILLNWHRAVWILILFKIYNFSSINILLHCCFFGSSTSSYLCFLWSEWYFDVISRKFLWSNPSSIYVFYFTKTFYHYLLLFPYQLFQTFSCLYQSYLYNILHRSFRSFYFFFHVIILS